MVITRRTRNPLALRGPWVRIPPAPPEAKHPARVLFLYEKGLPSKEPHAKNRKACQGSIGKTMERPAKLPLPLERNAAMRQRVCKGHHIIDTHSRSKRANISRLVYPKDKHIREKNVLQPSSLLLFCLLFFCFALSSVYHRPILEEGRIEKMEFPDVSSFPCPSPYRGCGKWQFGNRIHHLMRSFHPSTINIAEGAIFRPPGGKKFLKNFLDLSSGLRPAPFWGRSLTLRAFLPAPPSFSY